jgi:hypothetical protein
VLRNPVAVEKLARSEFAKIRSRQEALQTILPSLPDIFYHLIFDSSRKNRVFQHPLLLPTIIRKVRLGILGDYFLVARNPGEIQKQSGTDQQASFNCKLCGGSRRARCILATERNDIGNETNPMIALLLRRLDAGRRPGEEGRPGH